MLSSFTQETRSDKIRKLNSPPERVRFHIQILQSLLRLNHDIYDNWFFFRSLLFANVDRQLWRHGNVD